MQDFYNKALIMFLCLLLISLCIGVVCVKNTYLELRLLPANESAVPWRGNVISDVGKGGESWIKMNDDKFSLNFDFNKSKKINHPYVSVELLFMDSQGQADHADLSKYDTLSFNVKCEPTNTLYLGLLTFDEKVSGAVLGKYLTYRNLSTYFSCNENWSRLDLDLMHLDVPEWWFSLVKLDLSNTQYKLEKVPKITIGSSHQTPIDVVSKVQINDLVLKGHDWRFMYILGGCMAIIWFGYSYWFFRSYNKTALQDLREKIQRNLPLVAYQQLSVEPHRDKEKSAILKYMATEYANPELDPETMAAAVGVSRSKINDILKAELGYTFSVYLNKLRLTEAARLLEKKDLSIAEIAYVVGYKNISYFNKLFKEEYNCTPKAFKNLCNKD
jgi:AraC-like DNA-binding protein